MTDSTNIFEEWPEPTPPEVATSRAFPLHALPDVVREVVETLADAMQVDVTMPAVMALPFISAACGPAVIHAKDAYDEWGPLFTMLIAESGEMKSPVLGQLIKPLKSVRQYLMKRHRTGLVARELAAARAEKAFLKAKDDIDKLYAQKAEPEKGTKPPTDAEIAAAEKAADTAVNALAAAKAAVGSPPKLTYDDGTSQAMHDVMAEMDGRLFALVPEGDSLVKNLIGPSAQNRALWLCGHSGEKLTRELVGRDVKDIDNPSLSALVCAQRVVLENATTDKSLDGIGFIDRWAFAEVVTKKVQTWKTPPLNHAAVVAWEKMIVREFLRTWGLGQPLNFYLTPEADAVHEREYDAYQARRRADPGVRAGWTSKQRGMVLRLARFFAQIKINAAELTPPKISHPVISAIASPGDEPSYAKLDPSVNYFIGPDEIRAAWEISYWFAGQAQSLFGEKLTEDGQIMELAIRVLRRVRALDAEGKPVTVREVQGGVYALKTADATRSILGYWQQHHWLRLDKNTVVVHPEINTWFEKHGLA